MARSLLLDPARRKRIRPPREGLDRGPTAIARTEKVRDIAWGSWPGRLPLHGSSLDISIDRRQCPGTLRELSHDHGENVGRMCDKWGKEQLGAVCSCEMTGGILRRDHDSEHGI